MDLLTLVAQCRNLKKKKTFFYSPFVCHAFHLSCSVSVFKQLFYNEMLLFVETQKCPKYFCEPMVCNKWTGVVLKVLIFSLEW